MDDENQALEVGRFNIPILTYKYLETLVRSESYHNFPGTGVTSCCIVVENGYSITEDVVCANPSLFDVDTGRQRARRKVMKKLMALEHYLLRQRLYEAEKKPEESKHGRRPD